MNGIHLVPDADSSPLVGEAGWGSAPSLTYVKLGGSVITDKTQAGTLRPDNLKRLAEEIAAALGQAGGGLRVLVGHGGGSFAHFPAAHYQVRLGNKSGLSPAESRRGFVETRLAAMRLNQYVIEAFVAAGLLAFSIQPSATITAHDGQIRRLLPLIPLLALNDGCLPLVYGDAVFDEVRGYTVISTEQIFSFLASRMEDEPEAALIPSRIILVGEVDGVFTADPIKQPDAQLIASINSGNLAEVQTMLGGSHGVDVTGGMLTKIAGMYALCQQVSGLQVLLLNGNRPGLLQRALLGEPVRGTLIES